MYSQLEFFPVDDITSLRRLVNRVEESSDKVRRGTFAQIGKIGKKYIDQEQRIMELEHKLWIMEKCLKALNGKNVILRHVNYRVVDVDL